MRKIGMWGAIIVILLWFIQGVGVGDEWGGSVLLAMEWAKTNAHCGFVASWLQFGARAGPFLANIGAVFQLAFERRVLELGWCIPFFLSIIMVGIGRYIRLGIFETPVFSRILAAERTTRAIDRGLQAPA